MSQFSAHWLGSSETRALRVQQAVSTQGVWPVSKQKNVLCAFSFFNHSGKPSPFLYLKAPTPAPYATLQRYYSSSLKRPPTIFIADRITVPIELGQLV